MNMIESQGRLSDAEIGERLASEDGGVIDQYVHVADVGVWLQADDTQIDQPPDAVRAALDGEPYRLDVAQAGTGSERVTDVGVE